MRKRTGLRNKGRSGRSTYSVKHKSTTSDRYGAYKMGTQATSEIIAGHTFWWSKKETV